MDQILDFALAGAQQQDIVDLGHLIRQCEEHRPPNLPAKIALEAKVEDGFVFVTGSAVQPSLITTNPCANARDAIGDRNGTILLESTHAKQGGCHVRSELGIGTTISIYLPLTGSAPEKNQKKRSGNVEE